MISRIGRPISSKVLGQFANSAARLSKGSNPCGIRHFRVASVLSMKHTSPLMVHETKVAAFQHTRPDHAPAAADIDPLQIFDEIDANKNGSIDRDEFVQACEKMHINDLVALKQSLSRNELSSHSDDSDSLPLVLRRMSTMIDVTITKIFPAGFGWQAASVYAGNAGYSATSTQFFLCTGVGDFTGVLIGHTMGKVVMRMAGYTEINVLKEAQTGLLLGSAAFCSGFTWQPVLNACQALNMGFNESAVAVGGACSLAFFFGLRLFRYVYGPFMDGVEYNSYANLKADAGLSIAIGGATGCFVGTDVSFGAGNWLAPVVGIPDGTSDLAGQVIAGSSTALGFVAIQSAQSVAVPPGKCWVD